VFNRRPTRTLIARGRNMSREMRASATVRLGASARTRDLNRDRTTQKRVGRLVLVCLKQPTPGDSLGRRPFGPTFAGGRPLRCGRCRFHGSRFGRKPGRDVLPFIKMTNAYRTGRLSVCLWAKHFAAVHFFLVAPMRAVVCFSIPLPRSQLENPPFRCVHVRQPGQEDFCFCLFYKRALY
jgi:hypothetical protein